MEDSEEDIDWDEFGENEKSKENLNFNGLGIDVNENADSLEKRLMQRFKTSDLEGAQNIIFDNIDSVLALTKKFIPDKALPELKAQERCNWPGGSGSYFSDGDYKIKNKFRERWDKEEELLEAKHPRKVEKLWDPLKQKLEERYFRSFKSREDLAVMFGIFDESRLLDWRVSHLRELLLKKSQFNEFAKEDPNSGWEESEEFWNKYVVAGKSAAYASSLVGIIRNMVDPSKIFYNSDLTSWSGSHYIDFLKDEKSLGERDAMYFSYLFNEDKRGILSFDKVISLLYPEYAKEAGIEKSSIYIEPYNIPEEVMSVINRTLKNKYEERKPEDSVSKFMDWYSKLILKRWKSTAIDHERIFDYHDPSYIDKRIMSVFWTIKEGKTYTQDNKKEHYLRRLPGVLNAMLKDGIITEEQIDPPLKDNYLKPEEVLSIYGKNILNQKNSPLASLVMIKNDSVIATQIELRKMLPVSEDSKVPIHLQNDLSSLSSVLNPSKKYFTLFKGKHTLFVSSEEYWPNGDQAIGDIHRLVILPEGVNPKEGSLVKILGQTFNVTKQKSYKVEDKIRESLFDSLSGDLPVNSYTAIVDISPEEFKEKYFSDFMAHVLIHRPHLDLEGLLGDLKQIDELKGTELNCGMGSTGRVRLKTFNLGNKFGFQIKNEDDAMPEEVSFISKTLLDYIKDVGLPICIESDSDEEGRALLKRKLEDRVFFKDNFEGIVQALKGEGLPKILSYALKDKKYDRFNFGESDKPCEDCGKKYIEGLIYRPDLKEQWCDGFDAHDLHILSEHPHTFKFKFNNLHKIKRIISEAKDYKPAFFEFPGIMPEFDSFKQAHYTFAIAHSKSYNFWESTQGGVHAEEEELEDNPKLRELLNLETELHKNKKDSESKLFEAALKLQEKYDSLKGIKTEPQTDPKIITNYWYEQLRIFDIYKTAAPKLLGPVRGNL